ncbi:hypothetical protein CYMTET_37409 [Cymbomonas tetramitiformis]|uniref:Uncharacterized protein n=1 Tax=Cymbomonas tetramitiformis TaxID=36881 RepID=A0AAE0CGB1_9CHLO|nr:hypothetical protein CYMTET_37409 [Cymbomonas tetramitiformis]
MATKSYIAPVSSSWRSSIVGFFGRRLFAGGEDGGGDGGEDGDGVAEKMVTGVEKMVTGVAGEDGGGGGGVAGRMAAGAAGRREEWRGG